MRNAICRTAILLLQATTLFEAAAQSEFDPSSRSADHAQWMPISDVQPAVASNTRSGMTRSPEIDWSGSRTDPPHSEIAPIAQGFGTARTAADNVKAPGSDPESATLAAIKALHEEVKSLEARIAAQDARIAMLERTLETYTARNR
ncbi:MAG: hypothetical protein E6H71_06200 [Betaproteobacteria bacterium]|nr:MAG: hypothetical protein E6H71_06200 [Betaproteobacteria bacterium]